jgi:hypothetical protein
MLQRFPKYIKYQRSQRVQRLVHFNNLQSLGTFTAPHLSLSFSLHLWVPQDGDFGCFWLHKALGAKMSQVIITVTCSICTPKYRNRRRPNANYGISTNASKFQTRMILRTHGLHADIDHTSMEMGQNPTFCHSWVGMNILESHKSQLFRGSPGDLMVWSAANTKPWCMFVKTTSSFVKTILLHSVDGFRSLPSLRAFICVTHISKNVFSKFPSVRKTIATVRYCLCPLCTSRSFKRSSNDAVALWLLYN